MSVAAANRRLLSLETPEHVPIGFVLADLGSRLGALLLDLLIVFGALFVVALVAGLFLPGFDSSTTAILLLLIFLWRNFYFTASEIQGQGRTLGKRLLRLRVVARDGGPLTAEQIFARNLTRDLEVFLPLTLALAPRALAGEGPWWVGLATAAWIGALALVPFLNRQRARVGDLVAGTLVVVEPTGELFADLVEEGPAEEAPAYTFRPTQLDIYGIHELQVLEDVLRREPSSEREDLLRRIAEKVRAKIDWQGTLRRLEAEPFLRAFYAAQRHRLEHKMLLGKRQERKVR